MESYVLRLTVRNDNRVEAMRQDGANERGELRLNELYLRLIGIFESWIRANPTKISDQRELEAFGSLLYTALFDEKIGYFFERTSDEARRAQLYLRLELSFEEKVADLARLPWEFLYSPSRRFFLATRKDLALSRYMALPSGLKPLAPTQGPLRMLIAASQPGNLGYVDTEPTINGILDHLDKQLFQVDILSVPTRENFSNALRATKPHILHFIGHGRFTYKQGGEIALLASDDGENAEWVSDKDFAEYFERGHAIPHLVFLHLCEGGSVDFKDDFAGVAPKLILTGVQAVIAMQYPIANDPATVFSMTFYREIAGGRPVDTALQTSRYEMTRRSFSSQKEKGYNNPIFGIPVLYMRSRAAVIQPTAE